LTVQPNILDHVNMRSAPNGGGIVLQGQTQNMTTDEPLILHAAGYDRVCNYISDMASKWAATGVVSGKLFGNVNTGTSIVVQPSSAGTGSVTAMPNPDATCTRCGEVDVNVDAGTVHHFDVTVSTTSPRATVPFEFSVTAKDAFNNVVLGFNGSVALSFSWNASNGLNGSYLVQKPADGTTYTFNDGVLDPASFTSDAKRLIAARAGETATITI